MMDINKHESQIDEYGRAYVRDRNQAKLYKVADERPIHFIKSEFLKHKYLVEGRRVYMYTKDGGKFYLPPREHKPIRKEHKIVTTLDVSLYGFQKKAVEFIGELYDQGKKSCCVVSGTGTGKTFIINGIVQHLKLKTLVIVPNLTIGKQIVDKLGFAYNIKLGQGAAVQTIDCDVLVVTHQTLNKQYQYLNGKYSLLILDECHHLPLARINQINLRKGEFIVGLTATPQRKEFGIDGFKMIFGDYYDTEEQALPVKVYQYKYHHDYDMEMIMKAREGLAPESPEIYRRLMILNKDRYKHLKEILTTLQKQGLKRFIVFTDRIEHAKEIVKNLNGNVLLYIGESDKELIKKQATEFEEFIIVGNLQCCGEGFDVPSLEVGILFVSTQWTVSVDQAVGRVRRAHGNKTHGILIDFVDYLSFIGSKVKALGLTGRNKIYKRKERPVLDFKNG